MTEDDDGRPRWQILVAREFAAECRRDTEHTEKPRGHALLLDVRRLVAGCEVDAAGDAAATGHGDVEIRHRVAHGDPCGAVVVIAVAAAAATLVVPHDRAQTIGLWIGKRPYEQ